MAGVKQDFHALSAVTAAKLHLEKPSEQSKRPLER